MICPPALCLSCDDGCACGRARISLPRVAQLLAGELFPKLCAHSACLAEQSILAAGLLRQRSLHVPPPSILACVLLTDSPACRMLTGHLIFQGGPQDAPTAASRQCTCRLPACTRIVQTSMQQDFGVRDFGLASQSATAGRGGLSHVPGAHYGLQNMHRVSSALQAPERACGFLVKSWRLLHVGDNEDPST